MTHYVEPEASAAAYTCPHCGTLAQVDRDIWTLDKGGSSSGFPAWSATSCSVCGNVVVWHRMERRWPLNLVGPLPHELMPEPVREIYTEAREVGGVPLDRLEPS